LNPHWDSLTGAIIPAATSSVARADTLIGNTSRNTLSSFKIYVPPGKNTLACIDDEESASGYIVTHLTNLKRTFQNKQLKTQNHVGC
jgi:hypothetical protein